MTVSFIPKEVLSVVARDVERFLEPKGALVTRIEQYPLKKMINYLYIGGDDLKEWHQDMLAIVEKFAREKDCQGMELVGRKGWDRFLKECGWKAKHIICERFFDEEEAEQEKLNVA